MFLVLLSLKIPILFIQIPAIQEGYVSFFQINKINNTSIYLFNHSIPMRDKYYQSRWKFFIKSGLP